MTTINDILIGGFNFKWIEIGAIRKRSDLNNLINRFGVYIFAEGTCVSYVGMCGVKLGQKQDLKERIGQYFDEKDTGATFLKNWMPKNNPSHEDFKKYVAECNLVTLSTEETNEDGQKQLFGNAGIIGVMETFLIHELEPIYNILAYRNVLGYSMTDDEKIVSGWVLPRGYKCEDRLYTYRRRYLLIIPRPRRSVGHVGGRPP